MLCYSLLEKRGDYIKKYINWKLYNDGLVIVEHNNIECEYEKNKFISYKESEDVLNFIDIKNKVFLRQTDEFIFKIDFSKNSFYYLLKEKNIELNADVTCNMLIKDDLITLIYQIEDEKKELVIKIL